jgi:serine/threonine-protein kinase
MGLWRRWFGKKDTAPMPVPVAAPAPVETAEDLAERGLQELADRAASGQVFAAGEPRGALDELVRLGHERLALEWLDKLASALERGARRGGGDPARVLARDLALEAATRRGPRGELAEAVTTLESLTGSPPHAARAHMLLAEHFGRQGDRRVALRHLEAVLSIDIEYPNARARAEALRAELPLSSTGAAGETLAGPEGAHTARYQLVRQLGRGGSGVVYLARDLELERDVALKLLHPHLAQAAQAEARKAFFAEARLAAQLSHPELIAILDLGEAEHRLVMELARGGTLRARLDAGKVSAACALGWHTELMAALAVVHARGIVHRDLKPANLLLRGTDSGLVVTDFGVAHLAGADRRNPERAPAGTLAYMAPEVRRGEPGTAAADLWAAGVILWETLVGRLPFSAAAVLSGARRAEDLRLPDEVQRELGPLAPAVTAQLAGLAALDPDARLSSAAGLIAAERLAAAAQAPAEVAALAAERAAFAARWPPGA